MGKGGSMQVRILICLFFFCSNLYANCDGPVTPIHDIQSASAESPMLDLPVKVEGVVTASFQGAERLNGFFMQTPREEWDDDPKTSEGIFVNDANFGINLTPGQLVHVEAVVKERFGLTQLREISSIDICSQVKIPRAKEIEFPVSLAKLESVEGMKVSLEEVRISEVYNLARFGEILLSPKVLTQATQVFEPGAKAQQWQERQNQFTLLMDDDSNRQNRDPLFYSLNAESSIRIGDELDQIEGILSYAFGAYRIRPIQYDIKSKNERRRFLRDKGNIRIASFNLGNFFNGDGQGSGFPTSRGADSLDEYLRQKAKILSALEGLKAQIIAVQEIENDGFGSFSTIVELANSLSEQAASPFKAVKLDSSGLGSDQISVGILYNSNHVQEVGVAATLLTGPFLDKSRAPLVQTFQVSNDMRITIAANHFKSKSCRAATGLNDDQLDGQGCWNASRVEAVESLVQWLATHPTGVQSDHQIILGDLNSYAKEDPIQVLNQLGFENPMGRQQYSYVFDGRRGTLDYILISPSLTKKLKQAEAWHINADEPRVLDYNSEFKSAEQQQLFYAPNPFRSSDHDPVYLDLQISEDND